MSSPSDLTTLGCKRSYVPGERPGWHYRIEDGEFECWDTWLIPRAVLSSALDKIAGTVEVIGGTVARRVPLYNTEFTNAYAVDVQGDDDGWNHSLGTPYYVRAKIMYRLPMYPTTGADAYIRKSGQPGTRAMQLPPALTGLTYWITDNIQTFVHNFELVNLAEAPTEEWAQYGGYRNLSTWRSYPPGTVKFIPPTYAEQRTFGGSRQYSVTFGFDVCRVPWDQEYNEAGTLVSTGKPPYMDFEAYFGF